MKRYLIETTEMPAFEILALRRTAPCRRPSSRRRGCRTPAASAAATRPCRSRAPAWDASHRARRPRSVSGRAAAWRPASPAFGLLGIRRGGGRYAAPRQCHHTDHEPSGDSTRLHRFSREVLPVVPLATDTLDYRPAFTTGHSFDQLLPSFRISDNCLIDGRNGGGTAVRVAVDCWHRTTRPAGIGSPQADLASTT